MDKRFLGLAGLAVILLVVLSYTQHRNEPWHVSGMIEADEIRIGSRVGGRVHSVDAEEGSAVTSGQSLLEFEPYQLRESLKEAESQLTRVAAIHQRIVAGFRDEEVAQAKARFDQLSAVLEKAINGAREEDVSAAASQLELAESQLELSRKNFQRVEGLFAKMSLTQSELDQAGMELRVAKASREVRYEELQKLKRGTRPEEVAEAKAELEEANQIWLLRKNGYRPEEIAEAAAAVEAAKATVESVKCQIEELTVTSPINGIIEAMELRPGDLVAANVPVVSLLDSSHLWVRAYVPENRLVIKVGDRMKVTVDSYPNEQFSGHVSYISRQAEFTPGNVQTPEERSKQVFRFKVTFDGDKSKLRALPQNLWKRNEEGEEERREESLE
ncbi:MAG: HlyD family efflux transporter periplasmic adaptor subunit [Planctomycetes bacterium]|nr:HlyD family efflux transporter periplasmic adaptor subunit [Planctomycetota bacterium]